MAPQDADLVQKLLAAADLAAEVALVGEGEIGGDWRRDVLAPAGEEVVTTGVEEPWLTGEKESSTPNPSSRPLQGRGKQSQVKTGVQGGVMAS